MSEWRSQLAKYLMRILDGEKNIEIQRQFLNRVTEFEPYAAFQRFDRANNKFITLIDFRNFLKINKVRYSETVLNETFKQFDKDTDTTLKYEEFLKMVLTNTDYDLRSSVTQRKTYNVGANDNLLKEIEENIVILLKMEMNLVDEMMMLSEKIKYSLGFNLRETFTLIDYLNDKFLDYDSLGLFLNKNGFMVSDSDINQLIHRIDRDCDGKINYNDFREMFFPDKRYEIIRENNQNTKSSSQSHNFTISQKNNNCNDNLFSECLDVRASLNSYTSPLTLRYKLDLNANNKGYYKIKYSRFDSPSSKYLSNEKLDLPFNTVNFISSNSFEKSFSNLNNENSEILLEYFKKIISMENLAENIKESFALNADIHIGTFFNFFDIYKIGRINIFDFKEGLNNLNIYGTLEDARILFKRYDLNRDDSLSYNELSEMISPKKSEYMNLLLNKNLLYKNEVPEKTITNLAEVLRFLIDKEKQIENLREIISDKISYKISDVFDLLKGRVKNYILKEDVF